MKRIVGAILAFVFVLPLVTANISAKEEAHVFDEIKEYLVQDSYLADDGYIGIPISVRTYCKLKVEQTTKNTDVIIYVLGTRIERIGTESDIDILRDLLDEGYIVIALDYLGDSAARGEALIYSLKEFRKTTAKYLSGLNYRVGENKILPSGYRIASGIEFYTLDKNGAKGVYERIVSVWNGDAFKKAKAGKIPAGHEIAETIEDCVKPDGSPIDLDLRLDIIYPSQPTREVEVMMLASSLESRYEAAAIDRVRPIDVATVVNGMAFVCYDHSYIPMARDDHYGYFLPYGMYGELGISVHTSAARCVRYYADTFGYSRDNYGVAGHSKSSQCSILSSEHPELLEEWSGFASFGYLKNERYGEQRFLVYDDGGNIRSNVDAAYHSMGDGSRYYSTFLNENTCPTVICCGYFDQYGSWDYWANEQQAYKDAGVDHIAISMYDLGHSIAGEIDTVYQYDRFMAMFDFICYYLKGDQPTRILYSSMVGGKLISHDSEGKVLEGDEIFIQLLAPVTPESAEEGITLLDAATGREISGKLRTEAKNRIYFEPDEPLVKGRQYRFRVSDTLVGINGVPIKRGAEYGFIY